MHKRFSEEFKKSAIIRVQNGESQLSLPIVLGSVTKHSIVGSFKPKGKCLQRMFPYLKKMLGYARL